MRKRITNWQLDPGLVMASLDRVLRRPITRALWPRDNISALAERRAAELVSSHFRRISHFQGKSPQQADQIAKAHTSDPNWIGQAHVAMAIIDRYKIGLATFAKAFKLTADHPDALRRQFDALDLLGACEDYRYWSPQNDLGLKYRRQVRQLGQQRNKQRLARSLRVVARDLENYRLALGLLTKRAFNSAGFHFDGKRFRDLAYDDYEASAMFDFWYPEIPLYASMLATALQQLSKEIIQPSKPVKIGRHLRPDFVRIGHILFDRGDFPLPQMPRIGLAIGLIHLLAEMSDDEAKRRSYAESASIDLNLQRIPGSHYKVVAAFVSDAFQIDYSSEAAAKAIQNFRSRHHQYQILDWPSQQDREPPDNYVQNLR